MGKDMYNGGGLNPKKTLSEGYGYLSEKRDLNH